MYCFLAFHGSFPHPPGLPGITTQINYSHSGSASGICQLRHAPLTIHFCPTVMILGCTLIPAALALPFSCTSTFWCSFSHFNNNIRTRVRQMQIPYSSDPPPALMYILSPMKTRPQRKWNILARNIQCLWGLLSCLTSCRFLLISLGDCTYGILLRFVPGL